MSLIDRNWPTRILDAICEKIVIICLGGPWLFRGFLGALEGPARLAGLATTVNSWLHLDIYGYIQ